MKSKSKIKVTATETSRKLEFDIPNEEASDVTAGLLKKNHLKGLYDDYCVLNQEFLKYVLTCNFTGTPLKVLIFLIAVMDKENRIITNYKEVGFNLRISPKQADNALRALVKSKIIIRKHYVDYARRNEIRLNYDILNPQLAFKNKSSRENVLQHKKLIQQETPYIKQYNVFGGYDLQNPETGEIFHEKK